jgi:hypothetical protein
MKLEVVTDAGGLPLGMTVAAANVCEQQLLVPALHNVPVCRDESAGTRSMVSKCTSIKEAIGMKPIGLLDYRIRAQLDGCRQLVDLGPGVTQFSEFSSL